MNTILLRSGLLACALPALAVAQGNVSEVVPGRDFVERKLLSPGLTDVWKLTVEQDEMLWCQVDSDAFDPVLELVDADGKVLGTNDGEGTHSELWLRMPHRGEVEFRVHPFQGSGGGTYCYQLHRFGTQSLGAVGDATHRFGEAQWWHYRVSLHAGDVLVPTVLGDGRLTQVFDESRAPLAEALGGYRCLRDGDCFVRVEGPQDRSCRTITQLARRRDLPLDNAREETIAGFGLDHWRLSVQGGEAFALDLAMPGDALAVDLVDTQQDDRGPAFVPTGALDKGGQLRRWYVARRDAALELRVRNGSDHDNGYRMAVLRPARPLALGATAQGRMPLGDALLYELALDAGQLARIDLASACFDARFDVWAPDGSVIARADDRGPLDRDASHTFLVPKSGRYRVLAFSEGGHGGGEFAVTAASVEVPQLAPGVPLSIHADPRGPTYLHLDLHDGDVVWLSVQSRAFDACLQVLDPVGDGGFCCEGGGIGGDVLVAYRSSHDGRHTLLVHSRKGAGDGEVQVWPQTRAER